LDQSKNQNLDLGIYYSEKGRVSPSVVSMHLSTVLNAQDKPHSSDGHFSKKPLPLRLWDWFVKGRVMVTSDDLAIIRDELRAFESYLSGGLVYRERVVDMRIRICHAAEFLKERCFSAAFRRNLVKVEHFNQNQVLQAMQITQICGRPSWIDEMRLHSEACYVNLHSET
jgi:hypothetical protein